MPAQRPPLSPQRLQESIRSLVGRMVPGRSRGTPHRVEEYEKVAAAVAVSLLKAEIEALPPEQLLCSSGEFRVVYARAAQIPWCMEELGRLRELSFRAAGEGTGRASDIDAFDACYLHLFVWDADAHKIVGAYRMGLTDEILPRYGKQGLYTQSLFKYRTRVLQSLNPAIELGRSFVRQEYQRSYAALMLLWRGIGAFIARNPRYAVLFGAVSISSSYDPASRRLIVDYLRANTVEADLARHVKSRRPFHDPKVHGVKVQSEDAEGAALKSIEDLSRVVASIEPDAKGVPILLRQYLKLGGRVLGFNSDAQFSNALDGLMKVDLRNSDRRVLVKYMGPESAAAFLAYHAASSEALRLAS